ncbi:single-stranded DNA-binding protein [Lelliottia wanjuensis]|uniref:Single-stranded DNA-binding protein n=1 Tax=Lelliottia wanjuensis TaxID=3050585 RepID=A0AAP4CZ55_9ENTR|nr:MULTISPECIES: single-stranded DNA-binding protein [unclassified Lelliottia]MDK9361962.1 single-stranded DNA-binding protein [Lelliottia sp. V106_12]MDK9584313.1 single-stranded DNA-binding protein [Lelliottia sp. V86_10]MDK9617362.1 single-stranded DNA-binding protein [Lelliottia sp. V106_9]
MARRDLNKLCIIGYLGQDPEIRYTADKQPIALFSVATTESWRNKETGEHQERTQWHRVVVYNRLADVAAQFLKQGNQVYLEGRLKTRRWTDTLGAERLAVEVIVDMNGTLQILGHGPGAPTSGQTEIPPEPETDTRQPELPGLSENNHKEAAD